MSWRDKALCRFEDSPEKWFASPTDTETIAYAVAVCERCPVRERCAEYALTERIADGVWGGLTEQERETIRRRNQRMTRTP